MSSAVSTRVLSALVVGSADDLDSLFPTHAPPHLERAETPARAILHLARRPYDIVLVNHTDPGDLTDEQLAYMRGLQAVRPTTKFILLVSHSTTRKVIEALRHGVFAYFSRPFDPALVRDSIANALSLPDWSDGIEVLSAAPDFLSVRLRCRPYTADRLALFFKELPSSLSDEERTELSIAFREMLLNAIEHGGKLDPAEWVRVTRVKTRRTVVYSIHDPGAGFSREELQHAAVGNPPEDPTAHMHVRIAENMRAGGFGMLIASHLVDEVIYNQQGNEVILIKHLD